MLDLALNRCRDRMAAIIESRVRQIGLRVAHFGDIADARVLALLRHIPTLADRAVASLIVETFS